jgi:ankyrin repeat protein
VDAQHAQRRVAVVEGLLAAGANANEKEPADSNMPIHFAALCGDAPVIAALLAHGADPCVPSNEGYLPIHLAAKYPSSHAWQAIEPLVRAHQQLLDIRMHTRERQTPLVLAVMYRRVEAVRVLLQLGAKVDLACTLGTSSAMPLHVACSMSL